MEILSTGIRNPPEQQLGEAQSVYQRQISDSQLHHPQWGIILGTGMGGVADSMDDANSIPYEKLPGFSRSTISGHRGELLAGRLNGVPIIALNGRCHFYEGRSAREILFPVWLLHSLGIKNLLIGNASGGINPFFNSGEVMLIDDHLDLMFRSVPSSEILDDGVGTGARNYEDRILAKRSASPYSHELNDVVEGIGRRLQQPLHRGVYAALTGPNYETRAEYRMLKKIGADVVGMSTVPEAILASELGMRVCGLSTITNIANPDIIQNTSHEEVITAVESAEASLRLLIAELIAQVSI